MSSLPQGGFNGRGGPGRRRVAIVGGVVLLVLIGWSYAVLSYDGGSGAGGEEPGGEEPTGEVEARAGQTSSSSTPKTTRGGVVQEGGVPGDEEGTNATTTPGQPSPESGARTTPGEAGGSNAPPDPLRTGASADDLAEIDQERARFAAARFISAAYGYSGDDKDAYNQGVGQTVVWPAFYDSAGAGEIESYAAQVGESATNSGAKLTSFEAEETTPKTVEGYAYFETGEGYDEDGELTGERIPYRQQMKLTRSGAVWKVQAVQPIEEA